MTISLNYVHVARPDASSEFNATARRFVDTYRQFPPGCAHRLVVICANGSWTDEMTAIYKGVGVDAVYYFGNGQDIGAQQHAAMAVDADFMVAINSRAYFHRSGWLRPFLEARQAHGEGVYSAMASLERCPLGTGFVGAPNPHLRTAFYGMDASLWRNFPHLISSRADSLRFESGEWNIANWCEFQDKSAKLVTWDSCFSREDWRKPSNGFRSGDQTDCPAWDRHTDIYRDASEADKDFLVKLASGLL